MCILYYSCTGTYQGLFKYYILQVKVKSLVSIGSMMDILDKHITLNQIMPCIYEMDDAQPGVLMAILGMIYI